MPFPLQFGGLGAARPNDLVAWTPNNLTVPSKFWFNDVPTISDPTGAFNVTALGSLAIPLFAPHPSECPTVNATGLNGKRTLTFSSQRVAANNSASRDLFRNTGAGWALFVYRKTGTDGSPTTRQIFIGSDNAGATRFGARIGSATGSANIPQLVVKRLDADTATNMSGVTNNGTAWQSLLVTQDWSAGDGTLYINGAQDAQNLSLTTSGSTSNTAAQASSFPFYPFVLGSNTTNSLPADCELAETIIGAGSLPSPTEIDKLIGYVHHYWGITSVLDGAHPYKTTPPVV